MTKLSDYQLKILRDLRDDKSWAYAESVVIHDLIEKGYITAIAKMSGHRYEISEKGREALECTS